MKVIPFPVVIEDTEFVGLVIVEMATVGVRVEAISVPESVVPVVVWVFVVTD